MVSRVVFSRASDEWATPRDLLSRFPDITLDGAATRENCVTDRFYGVGGIVEDALTASPSGETIWLNPPYSRCREFVTAAARWGQDNRVYCLVPSRTDTRWWHDVVWEGLAPKPGVSVEFVRGRLKFGAAVNPAPFPSVIITFGGRGR